MKKKRKNRKIRLEVKEQIQKALSVPGCRVAEIAKRWGVSDWTVYQMQKSLNIYACQQSGKRKTNDQDPFVEVHVAQPDIPIPHQLHQMITLRKAMLEFEGLSVTVEGQIQHSHITGLINLLGGSPC